MTSGSQGRTVEVVIGCDTDPDREALVGPLPTDALVWNGVTGGIPMLKAAVADIRDDLGRPPAFTWLLRADEQVRALCGDYAHSLIAHEDQFRSLERGGDEIGWHPHFWRRDEATARWYQEVEDVTWQVAMLRAAHERLTTRLGKAPTSVRMGWNYHNAETLRTLDALGVAVDFSALPGFRTYQDAPPTRSENLFDWQPTRLRPYHPAANDPRRRAEAGEDSLGILELPIFVAESVFWAAARGVQLARKTRRMFPLGDALARPTYWINVTARPALFAPLLDTLRRALAGPTDGPLIFATYFHPDELIANRSTLYDLAYVRLNLRALQSVCAGQGARVEFRTASEVAKRLVTTPSS